MKSWTNFILVLLLIAALTYGFASHRHKRTDLPVEVKMSVLVSPAEQMDFVMAQANSARLKDEAGQKAGIKPGVALRLSITSASNAPMFKVEGGADTRAEGEQFVAAFMDILQARCTG